MKLLLAISILETLVLAGRGRLVLRPDAETWIRAVLRDAGPREAPLTAEVALRSRSLDLSNADPADRFIAATASVYGLTLVTADGSLQRAKGIEVFRA